MVLSLIYQNNNVQNSAMHRDWSVILQITGNMPGHPAVFSFLHIYNIHIYYQSLRFSDESSLIIKKMTYY